MKLPRDVSGESFARLLERLGSVFVRQKGSHARFTHPGPPQCHIAVPMHKQLKIGTLHDLLQSVAEQREIVIIDLIELL
jgi:predicted RNA binding protein YcfA (HicA-like mRNA interferase family)